MAVTGVTLSKGLNQGFERERQVAIAAAESAGALLRDRFWQTHDVQLKGDGRDVLLELDLIAERAVVQQLQSAFPDDRIYTEESGELSDRSQAHRPDIGRIWVIDPLDGSNNVAIGLTTFVVGIALCVGTETQLGVVHEPLAGQTYWAVCGRGAYAANELIRARHVPRLRKAGPLLAWTQGHAVCRDDRRALALRHSLELRARRLLQLWAPLLTWSMLARGLIDGFVGYRAEGVDFPAGALLAKEAGVELCALDGGQFRGHLHSNDGERSFIAARPEVMPELLRLVSATAS